MVGVAGHEWSGSRAGPSLAELFDPAELEARLAEARVRRRKVLADRAAGQHSAVLPEQPAAGSPSRLRLARGLFFIGGVAVGSIGVSAAIQVLRPSVAPSPYIAALPVPERPQLPAALAIAPGPATDPTAATLAVLAAIAADPSPEPPVAVAAVASKARGAAAVTPSLRLTQPPPGASIMRAVVTRAPVDGRDPAAIPFNPTPAALPSPGARPAQPPGDRPVENRPDPPQEPDVTPDPGVPPPSKPPKQANPPPPKQVAPTPPKPATPTPSGPAKGGIKDRSGPPPNAGRPPAGPGPARAGNGNGPPDHAHAAGRGNGNGHGFGGRGSSSHGSGKGGGNGNSGKGGGNGNSGKGGGGGNNRK